jgi:hypothetical protein|tara:strand:- start:365 stop:958 length:594 start_codon:yes stop_codon:yes gene_type:complete
MTNLFEELGLNITGRNSAPLQAHITRPLALDDINSLRTEGETKAPRIKQLRQRHHALAKALTDGIKDGEAGIICGYTASRVSILKADPTFVELMSFYAAKRENAYVELHDKIANLGEDVVDEMTTRLEDDPDGMSMGQLIELGKLALDRSGFGPQSNTNVNVNVGLSDKLAAARARTLALRADELTLEGVAKDVTPN